MLPEYEKDNKERIPFEYYMEEFKKMDPIAASVRTGIPYDTETQTFKIRVMQKEYEVSWPELQITTADSATYSPLMEMTAAKISVIRFLTQGNEAVPTDKYLTYREFPSGEVYFRQFNGRCIMRLAFSYGSKLEKFAEQMEKIGAKKLSFGDVSYEFEYMNGYTVRFILWAGDEEFPPSAQILFSDNFTISFVAEDLAVVGDVAIGTLKNI